MNAPTSLELVTICCRVLDEKKAEDLRVLDVSAQSSITDYLILANGTSQPHLRALRVELEKALDAAKAHIVGIETTLESGWTVIDVFEVMIHLFTTENRQKFGLENLWKDATEVAVAKLLAPSPVPAKTKGKTKMPRKRAPAGAKKKPTRRGK